MTADLLGRLVEPAITIVMIGYIECQAVTRNFSVHGGYAPTGNHEYVERANSDTRVQANHDMIHRLFALGLANLFGSFMRIYPTFASLPRSRILVNVGGRTVLANMMAAIIVLIAFLTLSPVLQHLPKATLSSIVFAAALGLIEVKEIGFVFKLRSWTEIFMFLATYIITFISSISTGIILCLGLSALLIVRKTTTANLSVMGRIPRSLTHESSHITTKDLSSSPADDSPPPASSSQPPPPRISCTPSRTSTTHSKRKSAANSMKFVDVTEHPDAQLLEGVVLLRVDAPLMFYNAGQARRSIEALMRVERRILIRRRKKLRRMNSTGSRESTMDDGRGGAVGVLLGMLQPEGMDVIEDDEENEIDFPDQAVDKEDIAEELDSKEGDVVVETLETVTKK
ncbi:Solute carrier 26, partial [Chytridiales sp. JEL 0842]